PSYLCASAGCHRALLSFPTRRSSDLRSVAVEFRPPRPDERGGVPRRAVLPPRNPAATRPPAHADTAAAGHRGAPTAGSEVRRTQDRKSTRLNSSHVKISYAVFCLKKR